MTKPPKGWKIERLDKLAEIQTGIAKGAQKEKPVVILPYLRVANVQDGHVDLTEMKTIEVPERKLNRYLLRRGDLLMTEGGDFDKLGRGCIWEGQIEPCVHQNHVFAVRVTSSQLRNDFLEKLTASPWGRRYFLSCSKQSTNLASVNTSQLKAFPVLLPPVPEQRKLSRILETWDTGIERLKLLLSTKRDRLSSLRQQLVAGVRRFPNPKKNLWTTRKIGDLLKPVNRYEDWNDQRIFKLAGVRRNSGGVFFRAELPGSKIKVKVCKKIHANDFLISRRQVTWGGMSIVPPEFHGYDVNDEYEVLQVRDPATFDMRFFHYLSQTATLKNLAYLASNGVFAERLRLNFDLKAFLNHPIRVPPTKAEQLEIVTLLDACVREIHLLEAELEALKQQKRGLMQKLLTGEIRVKAK